MTEFDNVAVRNHPTRPHGRVVFIGGEADGQFRSDPGWPVFWFSPSAPLPIVHPDPCLLYTPPAEYRRETIYGGATDIVFYVACPMTASEAVGKLIQGYSPAK